MKIGQTLGDGRILTQRKLDYFTARMALRNDPDKCPRCCKSRGEKFRTCDKCRERVRRAKLKQRGVVFAKGGLTLESMAGMVIQMRREMDKMQTRFKLWQRAIDYRRSLKYRTNTMRKKYLKPAGSLPMKQK